MSDSSVSQTPPRLPLTPRQIRLRYLTLIVVGVIILMIVAGVLHPFFRMTPPAALTDRVHPLPAPELRVIRRAFAAKLLVIGLYWAACMLLTLLLPIFAWLYTREIHLQELMARRDIWREVAGNKGSEPEESREA